MQKSSTLLFFGSGPVAAATLSALKDAGFQFEAIVTKPRAESFKGSVPVLELAEQWGVEVITPLTKQQLSEMMKSYSLSSSLGLVVDYGLIIAKDVIELLPDGIMNSHFSLLPEWRGADPITFALLSGQEVTGVSLMLINEKLDEGFLIDQQALAIESDTTIHQLTQQLIELSNQLLIKDIPLYLSGKLKPYPQSSTNISYSRKLAKEDGKIDWQKTASMLEREVRAYQGWPKSYGQIMGRDVIVLKAQVVDAPSPQHLVVSCGEGTWLDVLELIAPSGRKMSGADFLRGYGKTA